MSAGESRVFGNLLAKWRSSRKAWSGFRSLHALPRGERRIVFYAESAADWAFLGPVRDGLIRHGLTPVLVTSDPTDPNLGQERTFWLGSGAALTVFFRSVDADIVVMTLSDLDQYHLKRSKHPVHYVYVFHSIASTHRIYREHAFDAYDTILCVGPHHIEEIRATERIYGLRPKRLLDHGYGRLDTLLAARATSAESYAGPPRVLVAPSWGPTSLVAHGIDRILDVLVDAGLQVTLRLHPMTRRHHPELAGNLTRRYEGSGSFRFDPHIGSTESIMDADVLISEWSGALLDYAFCRERPAISIDTPPKINNPAHGKVGLTPVEQTLRNQVGVVVALDQVDRLPEIVRQLAIEASQWKERIRTARDAHVFHVGSSGEAGARHIADILDQRGRSGAAPEENDV